MILKPTRNIFAVDLEDWYHSFYQGGTIPNAEDRIESTTETLLKLLDQTQNHATFFVVGDIAIKHPELIKEIFRRHHEIASHSHRHLFVFNQTPTQFETDLKNSKTILEDIIRSPIIGYRAPAWSVSQAKTPWFWSILKKNKFLYSSSLCPFKTFLYGDDHAITTPHFINSVLEIPPSTFRIFSKNYPFSGGFYLRLLPLPVIKLFCRTLVKQNIPLNFYIHPREIDPAQPRKPLPAYQHFIHYHNINNTLNKLRRLFTYYRFTGFKSFFHL
ncbi:MAG: polysaccharide deacetylase family protein [Candidatus Shapirobacteria bacterium]|jgi:polysaccharide deacetylase family protein (PEP-CTERM system associated)